MLGFMMKIRLWRGTAHARTSFSSGRFLKSFAYPIVIRGDTSCFVCKEKCTLVQAVRPIGGVEV
jgi:hypothetical protein